MALKIILPDNHHAEWRYAVEVLLQQFLGLYIEFSFGENRHCILELENGARLTVEDHFFNQFSNEKGYLSSQHIPADVPFSKKDTNLFIPENDLPVIFGNEKLEVTDTEIVCGIDIFASAFFMLTRWEEFVSDERDSFGRFPAEASLAARAGFLHRPVVNEYVEMLWKMLCRLGIRQERKKQSFQLLLTHDVDYPLLWTSPYFFLKKLCGDILKRNSLTEAAFSVRSYLSTKLDKQKDPYDTFDYLIQVAERANVPAHFFFMAGGKSKFDPKYDLESVFVKKLMTQIHERGHRIGIHPSFDSFDNEEMFKAEKSHLEAVSPQPITCGRQHFLRFSLPETWQIWEKHNMEWDSTLGYPEQEGFRCGVCYPFQVFDILERKKLKLKEIPLLAMDTTFALYQKYSRDDTIASLRFLLATVKKYNGTFSLLWHNSSFETPGYKRLGGVYEEVLEMANTSE